jgi:superfamily I DNA and/or RNA helicase
MFAERAAVKGKLRVAISCQTHNAVNIVLQSIASKLARLQRTKTEFATQLEGVQLYKIGEDESEANAALGVSALDPWQHRAQLDYILNSQLLVIGATPGGLYKLIKQKTGKAATAETMWQTKFFDLVILDEASQMNLPQALLASAWLRDEGQLIVVGDHRQMAPILAHGWDTEDRLNTIATHPYRSVFQYLVDQNFPRVALDESFRLHRVQAAFLQANIYSHDGINFHSRREQLLPALDLARLSPYLQAVMHPDYPIIVILHHEHASQQANHTEADLLSPIIQTCVDLLHLDGKEGIGVVVPHRAQKALLRERFPALAASDAVDTVERFQGDEREVIIVSATASDPDYVLAEAEFLLNPNRLNVALSRPRQKLIVVAAATVFKFLAADLEIFDKATLWKRLLAQCAREPLWQGPYVGTTVQVFGCQA